MKNKEILRKHQEEETRDEKCSRMQGNLGTSWWSAAMAPCFQGRRPGNAGESGDFLVVCGCGSVLPRLEAWVPFLGRGLDPACHNLDLVRPNKEFKKKKRKNAVAFQAGS